jgi:hypothetical protein
LYVLASVEIMRLNYGLSEAKGEARDIIQRLSNVPALRRPSYFLV